MNLNSLNYKINLFEELVIKSGFKRDIADYYNSIQQSQNQNLIYLKDITERVINSYNYFYDNSLDTELNLLLKEHDSFLIKAKLEELNSLLNDKEIDSNNYFNQLNNFFNILQQQLSYNISEIESIKKLIDKYLSNSDSNIYLNSDKTLISLIFRDLETTTSLKEFLKILNRWNRTLLLYHTILKSESPKEIELVEIQNGSIDVIFNIDIDVSLDLAELIKIGLGVYGSYLMYKTKLAKAIILSYLGNQKLIESEKERETLMLDNIQESIKQKVIEQHNENYKFDDKIDNIGIEKKAEEISKVVTEHIIKGNDFKLLNPPSDNENDEDENEDGVEKKKSISTEIREESAIVKSNLKILSKEDKQILIDKYSILEEEENKKSRK